MNLFAKSQYGKIVSIAKQILVCRFVQYISIGLHCGLGRLKNFHQAAVASVVACKATTGLCLHTTVGQNFSKVAFEFEKRSLDF